MSCFASARPVRIIIGIGLMLMLIAGMAGVPQSLSAEPEVIRTTPLDGEPLWPTRPAAGRCEVICFSPDASASLATVGHRRMRTIIEAWAHRTSELSALPGVEQVFCFENRGREIGVTLHHPHGQIYAYPYLTPRTETMLRRAREHRAATGRNLLRDVLDAELRSGRRVVAESEHWVAYVPAAARWPVEVHLAPRRDVPDLPALTDAERTDLADIYLRLLRAGDQFFVTDDETARFLKSQHRRDDERPAPGARPLGSSRPRVVACPVLEWNGMSGSAKTGADR